MNTAGTISEDILLVLACARYCTINGEGSSADGRYLTLRDTNELHAAARDFIARELRALSPEERARTIVCTHFWPTLRPWTDEAGRPLDDHPESQWLNMTGSDLDELVAEAGPRYWLCGHAHTTHQVTIGATHVESNPRAGDGPGHVNPEFAESYVVEL